MSFNWVLLWETFVFNGTFFNCHFVTYGSGTADDHTHKRRKLFCLQQNFIDTLSIYVDHLLYCINVLLPLLTVGNFIITLVAGDYTYYEKLCFHVYRTLHNLISYNTFLYLNLIEFIIKQG